MTTPSTDQEGLYKTLLESTRAIPWKLNWATKAFEYIGPQIKTILGWGQDSWLTVHDWAECIHPDEREQIVNRCFAESENGSDHEFEYRARTAGGHYVWLRDVVHVICENGAIVALVGVLIDISECKHHEETLRRLNRQLETLSFHDSLTGLANRRLYDRSLQVAWTQAKQQQTPLALAVLDIDYFKQYNDALGHAAGDDCLRWVADTLNDATVIRPSDVLARYGGEEFVLIMPETTATIALEIAETFRARVAGHRIAHPNGELLTISGGVAAVVPSDEANAADLFQYADRMLYAAKRGGRNQVKLASLSRDDAPIEGINKPPTRA